MGYQKLPTLCCKDQIFSFYFFKLKENKGRCQGSMLQNYIKLNDRKTGQKLDLTDKGIIISEKLAELAGVSVGDYLTVQNSQDKDIKLKVAGSSEMYM